MHTDKDKLFKLIGNRFSIAQMSSKQGHFSNTKKSVLINFFLKNRMKNKKKSKNSEIQQTLSNIIKDYKKYL